MPFTTTRGNPWATPPTPAVEYELIGEISETERADGVTEHVVVAQTRWADKDRFVQAILPDVRLNGTLMVTTPNNVTVPDEFIISSVYDPGFVAPQPTRVQRLRLERLAPQVHPRRSKLFATEAKVIKGVGYHTSDGSWIVFKQGQTAADGYAHIAVTFKTLPYDPTPTDAETNRADRSELLRYVSRDLKGQAEHLPLRSGSFYFWEASTAVLPGVLPGEARRVPENALVHVLPKDHVTFTWHMVPLIPIAALSLRGRVNSDVFDWDYSGAAAGVPNAFRVLGSFAWPGTGLYMSYETSKTYVTYSGTFVRDLTYHLLVREPGHNWFFRPGFNRFDRIASLSGMSGKTILKPYTLPNGEVINADAWLGQRNNLYKYAPLESLFKANAYRAVRQLEY